LAKSNFNLGYFKAYNNSLATFFTALIPDADTI